VAKFDLFNEHTWEIEIQDREKLLRNKAMGHLGTTMGDVRALRDTIEAEQIKSSENNEDLRLALALQKSNPEAFKIMAVNIIYPDAEITEILRLIDQVMVFWNDKDTRDANWRHIVKLIQPLKPYLERDRTYYGRDNHRQNIDGLVSVKVVGNVAWEVYKTAESRSSYWYAKYESIKPATVYESDDSTDDLGDSEDD
jgi:hypothetical protein